MIQIQKKVISGIELIEKIKRGEIKPRRLPDPEEVTKRDDIIRFFRSFGVKDSVIKEFVESGELDKCLNELKRAIEKLHKVTGN